MADQNNRERLLTEERQLASALADFEHQIRRLRDQMERGGGRAPLIEAALRQAEENLELARRDIDRVRKLLESGKAEPG
jgi:multidrug resistance efflux pump